MKRKKNKKITNQTTISSFFSGKKKDELDDKKRKREDEKDEIKLSKKYKKCIKRKEYVPIKTIPIKNEMWVEKYKPTSSNDIIGNGDQINNIKKWLKAYPKVMKKYMMITGDPGIGKSTSVNLIGKEFEFKIIEINASIEKGENEGKEEKENKTATKLINIVGNTFTKNLLLIEEIDGMKLTSKSFKKIIKNAKIPIICISNDNGYGSKSKSKKIKELIKNGYHIAFLQPSIKEISKPIFSICEKENIQLEICELNQLCESLKCDVRSILNNLQFYSHNQFKFIIPWIKKIDSNKTQNNKLLIIEKYDTFSNYCSLNNIGFEYIDLDSESSDSINCDDYEKEKKRNKSEYFCYLFDNINKMEYKNDVDVFKHIDELNKTIPIVFISKNKESELLNNLIKNEIVMCLEVESANVTLKKDRIDDNVFNSYDKIIKSDIKNEEILRINKSFGDGLLPAFIFENSHNIVSDLDKYVELMDSLSSSDMIFKQIMNGDHVLSNYYNYESLCSTSNIVRNEYKNKNIRTVFPTNVLSCNSKKKVEKIQNIKNIICSNDKYGKISSIDVDELMLLDYHFQFLCNDVIKPIIDSKGKKEIDEAIKISTEKLNEKKIKWKDLKLVDDEKFNNSWKNLKSDVKKKIKDEPTIIVNKKNKKK